MTTTTTNNNNMAETWAKVAAMPPKAAPETAKGGKHSGMALPPTKGGAMPTTGLWRSAPVPAASPSASTQPMATAPAAPSADQTRRSRHQRQLHAYSKTARSQPSAADSAAATGSQRSRATHQAAQVNFNFRLFAFFLL